LGRRTVLGVGGFMEIFGVFGDGTGDSLLEISPDIRGLYLCAYIFFRTECVCGLNGNFVNI